MNATQSTPDFAALATRAATMSLTALRYSADDCAKAAEAADALERAGCRVLKTGGYYRDEASVYRAEIRARTA